MCAERHRCLQLIHAVRQAVNSRRCDPRQRRPRNYSRKLRYRDHVFGRRVCAAKWMSMKQEDINFSAPRIPKLRLTKGQIFRSKIRQVVSVKQSCQI